MDRSRVARSLALFLVALLVAYLLVNPPLFLVSTGSYGNATVTAVDANGTDLATVDVRIADTENKQRVGLSRTESLGPGEGMLFVFAGEDQRTFHMQGMAFPLDMVFVAGNGTVTAIRHAPVPADAAGSGTRYYSGYGQYVLEVTRGWANRTGVEVGDRIAIPESVG